jgi:hypothetical protein
LAYIRKIKDSFEAWLLIVLFYELWN